MSKLNEKKAFSHKHWIPAVIVLITGYSIYFFISDNRKSSQWTYEDGQVIINQCLKDAGEMTSNYPELTENYCRCSMVKIRNKFSREEYIEIVALSLKDQSKLLSPVFEDCLNDYKKKIEEIRRHGTIGVFRP
ncbi:hypothetical protein LVD17_12830 [Fulvivirga ulvae]|uniref:hypothetical protein n=1 Tax=Fulvivirga ulvae TaxID=2904245 RepID=UPI001F40F425|nr:hypothetical protein [Fulvivirga ulvae]UII34694.1 hypothetical protein LVD17_12830 [Fulvivirga ulvae]